MPAGRPRNHAKHLHAAVAGLVREVGNMLRAVQGAAVSAAPAAASPREPGQRGAGKNNQRLKAALKKSWAAYSPKQRAERIRRMLAGRGLKPKGAAKRKVTKRSPRRAATRSAPKRVPKVARPKSGGGWASMTPDQRAARIAKMQAGRTPKPSAATTAPVAAPARQVSLLSD